MQRGAYTQYPAQAHQYSANAYSVQPAFTSGVQYTTRDPNHAPYYPGVGASVPPLPTNTQSAPQQQITTSNAGHHGHQSDGGDEAPASPQGSQYDDTMNYDDQRQDDGDEDGEDPVFHLPPPPENTYDSVEELDKAMHAWSLEHGYELVRRASKKNAKGVLYKRYYHCSKHGKLANTGKLTEATRVRVNRKSNRINCPMSLAVVAVDPTNPEGQWQIRHRKIHHNHGPMDALTLAGHRRRARMGGVEKAVDGLFAIGTPTTQVLQFLQRTNPNGLFTRTDVANMKLKYKKNGTCIDKKDASQSEQPRAGTTSACHGCRSRKTRCDAQRPTCGHCAAHNQPCVYDHDEASEPIRTDVVQPVPPPVSHNAQREVILANLQTFQATHVKATRLTPTSAAVEVLAASSCGNGDSYQKIQRLENTDQWPEFRNAVSDASMKEITFDVLMGHKQEPSRPPEDCTVEEWNEVIKQQAIFNRRNTALLGAILPRLGHQFRSRVSHVRLASVVWQILDDLCQPRGSETAYKLYLELSMITLQNSQDLKEYILRLEIAYNALNQVAYTPADRHSHERRQLGDVERTMFNPWTITHGIPLASNRAHFSHVYSEEMLIFQFLRGLTPEFRRFTETLCSTGNLGGFGTGRRLGFADVTRSTLEWQSSHLRNE